MKCNGGDFKLKLMTAVLLCAVMTTLSMKMKRHT